MEIVGGSLDLTGFCDEMRRLIDMIERGDVGVGGFKMNLGYDGELELQVSIIGVGGAKTETMRSINGTMLPVTTRGPAPGAQELINGLIQATQGGARANPLAATAAPPSSNPWTPDQWSLTKQGQIIRQYGADYAGKLAVAAKSYIGAEQIARVKNEIAAAQAVKQLKELELAEAEAEAAKTRRPKVPDGTRDLDLDI